MLRSLEVRIGRMVGQHLSVEMEGTTRMPVVCSHVRSIPKTCKTCKCKAALPVEATTTRFPSASASAVTVPRRLRPC